MTSNTSDPLYDASLDPTLDHSDVGPIVIAISVVFAAVSSFVVALRLYTRVGILGTAGWDDWTILMAAIFSIAVSVTTILEAKFALGRHIWDAAKDPSGMQKQLESLYAVIILYNFAMNLVKFSFLLQYRRIFRGDMIQRVCLWFMVYVAIWSVVQDTILGLSCIPLEYMLPYTADFCLDTLPVWYVSSGMNIVTDFAIFTIPLPAVAGLQLHRKQKLLVFGVFCLGFFTCIISLIRIFTLKAAVITEDPTWDNVGTACWSVVELNCAILCSCLPTLKPLISKMVPGFASTRSKGYEMYASHGTRPGAAAGTRTGTHGAGGGLQAPDMAVEGSGRSHRTSSSGSQVELKDNAAVYEYEKGFITSTAYAGPPGAGSEQHGAADGLTEGGRFSGQMPGGIVVTTETRIDEKQRRL